MTHSSSWLPGSSISALVGGLCFAVTAGATQLNYATGYPGSSIPGEVAVEYAEAVEEYSGGELSVRVFHQSLLSAAETSDGVRDGVADIGYLLTVYFPERYAHTNFLNEASMQLLLLDDDGGDNAALAYEGAMAEFTFFHCPECNDEYRQQNQVYTANAASSWYGLLCREPVVSIDDMQGKRMRTAGSQWSRWSSHFGATSVSLTINEVYEALEQGVVDCVVQSAPELLNLRLIEPTTDITMAIPGGIYAGANGASVNRDAWQALTDNQRDAMLRAGARLTAEIPFRYQELEEEALTEAEAQGVTLHEPDQELLEATRDFVEQDQEKAVSYYAEDHGVERGAEILTEFREILEKWVDLVEGIDNTDDLTELYWEEIFSRVDVSSHGMD